MFHKTLSKQVKANGCPSAAALGRWLGVDTDQLYRWHARNNMITQALSIGYAASHGEIGKIDQIRTIIDA